MNEVSDHYNQYFPSLIEELVLENPGIDGKARECSSVMFYLL